MGPNDSREKRSIDGSQFGDQRRLEEASSALDAHGAAARDDSPASRPRVPDERLELGHVRTLRDRPERRLRAHRVAHDVCAHERLGHLDESPVDGLVHVDPLDGAAALARVVDGAVDDVLDGLREVAVGGDVRGVVPAELEARVKEALRGRLDDAVPTEDAPREDDVIDAVVGDDPLALRVVTVQRLHEIGRRPGLGEGSGEVLARRGAFAGCASR